jgi:hypothetical protein
MSSTTKKIEGIYLRGNVFWFRHRYGNGRRIQVTLKTKDEAVAIQVAKSLIEQPELTPADPFTAELEK